MKKLSMRKSHDLRRLRILALSTVSLCLVIQIIIEVCCIGRSQISDCIVHINLAQGALDEGALYPTASNLYDTYLLAPVLIQWIQLQLYLFGTVAWNGAFNILLNLLICYDIYYIGKKLFDERTALISVTAWSLLYSVWTSGWPLATEVPFLALSISAVALVMKTTWWRLLLAGLLLGCANSIRPLVLIYIPTIIGIMWWRKCDWRRYGLVIIPFVCFIALMGSYVYSTTGYFRFTSTTGGLNMIIAANDKATGALPPNYRDTTCTDARIYLEDSLDYVH